MSNLKKTRGFTLVEIMIVVAIIGLLAAIAVPNFVQARTSARNNTCINNLRLIAAAKDQYALENNVADTVVPTSTNLSPYLKGTASKVWCPLDTTKTFANSYTIGEVSINPVCQKDATNHKL